jgi:hypothetical protein
MAHEKWLLDGPKTIDFDRVHTLKVGLVGGRIDIVGHDEVGARVEVHTVGGTKPLKVTIEEGVLEIDHPQVGWENMLEVFSNLSGDVTAEISLMVPRDVSLKFGTVSASALISGLDLSTKPKPAKISTGSGEIVVDQVRGDIELNSVSGEFSVSEHHGRVGVRSVGGDVTASGDIPKFTCDTVSGDVFLDLAGTPDEVRVNTVSGDVAVRLAHGVAASYRITTAAGRLTLDDSEIRGVRGSYQGKYGELSGDWLEFRANTVNGNVSVMHASQSDAPAATA